MILNVGKIEVAKRQLEAALREWFADGDDIAIATLVFPAHQIVADLCAHKGEQSYSLRELFKHAGYEDQFCAWMDTLARQPVNFVKHADRDAESRLNIDTEFMSKIMLLAIDGLQCLGELPSRTQIAFRYWMAQSYPDVIRTDGPAQPVEIKARSRHEFHQTVLKMLENRRAELTGLIEWD